MMRDTLRHQLARHTDRLAELDFLLAQPDVQLFVTATEPPPAVLEAGLAARVFHVEQGRIGP